MIYFWFRLSIKHLRLICTCQISVFVAPACCHSCGYPNRDNFTKEAVVRSWTDRMLHSRATLIWADTPDWLEIPHWPCENCCTKVRAVQPVQMKAFRWGVGGITIKILMPWGLAAVHSHGHCGWWWRNNGWVTYILMCDLPPALLQ